MASDPPRRDDAAGEATAAFLMRLRGRGVRDLSVLRAMEETPRHLFVPQRYRDLAFRELHLPLPCGQSMPDAFFVARLAEAAMLRPEHRVLEIGAGSGYCTAVFARLCRETVALERYRTLVIEATARLDELKLPRAQVQWMDGAASLARLGRFDRIVVHAALDETQREALLDGLAENGLLVCAERLGSESSWAELARISAPTAPGARPERVSLGRARLRPLERGLAAAL